MAKIFVTGGSGMIGKALVESLVADEHQVNLLDIWETNMPGAKYFKGTILNSADIDRAIGDCDYVVHLAATLGVELSTKQPLECLDVNVLGTRNILEACAKHKIKRIVFSSSSEVYGEPEEVPIKETASYSPKSEYGASKIIGEEYIKAFNKKYGLEYTIIRFFNVYGKQRNMFVVPKFVNAALEGKDITLYGDGKQVRAFCYVEDAIDGIKKALFSETAKNGIFNIGNSNDPTTMEDLAKTVIKLTGSKSKLKYLPFASSDRSRLREIFKRMPDITKARETLGYEPKYNLEEGLKKVIQYYKENQKNGA